MITLKRVVGVEFFHWRACTKFFGEWLLFLCLVVIYQYQFSLYFSFKW